MWFRIAVAVDEEIRDIGARQYRNARARRCGALSTRFPSVFCRLGVTPGRAKI
jgi:hypothetical protein